jgi:hypothetical protein
VKSNDLAQTMKVKRRRILIDAHQRGRRPSRRPSHEMLDQSPLLRPAQSTLPHTTTILVLSPSLGII